MRGYMELPIRGGQENKLAAFSTTKETVVDCKLAVAVPRLAISYRAETVASPVNTSKAASEDIGRTPACTVLTRRVFTRTFVA